MQSEGLSGTLCTTLPSAAGTSSPAVQEAAMYSKLTLMALLVALLAGCAPYDGPNYYRTDVYSVDRSYYGPRAYPYSYGGAYYVTPAPRYYYSAPQPRYYRPPAYHGPRPDYRPGPRPGWNGGDHRPGPGWSGGPRPDHRPGMNPGPRPDHRADFRPDRGHGGSPGRGGPGHDRGGPGRGNHDQGGHDRGGRR